MDGGIVGNGWQPELAMDGNQNCGQWMATEMRAMDGNRNCWQWMATRM